MKQTEAVMTALRIKGFAKADVLDAVLGFETSAILADLEASGLVKLTKLGAKLTDAGKAQEAVANAADSAAAGREAVEAVYARFEAMNGPFKALITRWQSRDVDGEIVPNDHMDTGYDQGILAELLALDGDTQLLCEGLAGLTPRLAQYGPRFSAALDKLRAGEMRYMAAPIIDSYHTIWFELHEDLITFSGRNRAEEAAAGRAV